MDDGGNAAGRLAARLGDRSWRLSNLYWILDKQGKKVLFSPNSAQRRLLGRLHYLNIVLKARQLGFSTLIQILMLDLCLFNSNTQAGVIAHNLEDAKAIFDLKIKFAYDNLPDWLKNERRAVSDRAQELAFNNGSRIRVATSLRSGTMQFLHVSEYGKICRKFPDKAKEVKTGTLQTVAPGQFVFIESTAEGRFGDFFDMTQTARRRSHDPRPLSQMEYRFHFFPWFEDPAYIADPTTPISDSVLEYCNKVETQTGAKLSREQRAWYYLKSLELGEDMKQEYPSTPDEAFEQAIEGAYYTKQMTLLRKQGQIRPIPLAPSVPVDSFWDIGWNDHNAIWLMQRVAGQYRFLKTYQNSGEGFEHYLNWIRSHGYLQGKIYLPHDAQLQRQTATGGECAVDHFYKMGVRAQDIIIVPRVALIKDGIEAVRQILPTVWMDAAGCAEGITALDSYRKEWNDRLGVWKDTPLHDENSHLSDAFRQFAQSIILVGASGNERLPVTGRVV